MYLYFSGFYIALIELMTPLKGARQIGRRVRLMRKKFKIEDLLVGFVLTSTRLAKLFLFTFVMLVRMIGRAACGSDRAAR